MELRQVTHQYFVLESLYNQLMALSDFSPIGHENAQNGNAMFPANVPPLGEFVGKEDVSPNALPFPLPLISKQVYSPVSENQSARKQSAIKLAVTAPDLRSVSQKEGKKNLSEAQEELAGKFVSKLEEKAYTKRTARSYGNALRTFLKAFPDAVPNELSQQEIELWLHRRMRNKKLSAAQHNTMISAIQLYYQLVEGILGPLSYLKRPKAKQVDPQTISKEEIQRLINASGSLKNRCLLLLTYSAGLRVMEVLSLRKVDLDLTKMTIFVQGRKGKNGQQHHRRSDRTVPLSRKLAKILEQYLTEYVPAVWLFEGNKRAHKYSERSAQSVMQQAAKKAGLVKTSLKMLRASYAAHQLEAGISVSAVQDLMGHNSIRTTTRFAHVAKRKLPASPADNLDF